MTTLFLLAHQDDEIGVFHELSRCKRFDGTILCAFLTNGAWGGVASTTRNAESRKSLQSLGISDAEMRFIGTEIDIPDGALVEHLERCYSALHELIEHASTSRTPIKRIIMHAWEGGHQDHDSAHLLGLALALQHKLTAVSRQFPLYRHKSRGKGIAFAAPIAENGAIEKSEINLREKLNCLRLLMNYRSQWKVIARLLPYILTTYLVDGSQKLQPITPMRVQNSPNTPPMLYETWGLYSYQMFRSFAEPFIERRIAEAARMLADGGKGA